jgi:hypothetical protein
LLYKQCSTTKQQKDGEIGRTKKREDKPDDSERKGSHGWPGGGARRRARRRAREGGKGKGGVVVVIDEETRAKESSCICLLISDIRQGRATLRHHHNDASSAHVILFSGPSSQHYCQHRYSFFSAPYRNYSSYVCLGCAFSLQHQSLSRRAPVPTCDQGIMNPTSQVNLCLLSPAICRRQSNQLRLHPVTSRKCITPTVTSVCLALRIIA